MISPSPTIQAWLDYPTSITDRLKIYHPNVHLVCLKQAWFTADAWEQTTIDAANLFRREILMYAGEHACWYARTMIPEHTYTQEQVRFARLKTEPLGQIIWQSSDIERQHMTQFCLDQNTLLYQHLTQIPQLTLNISPLWGRLSTFIIKTTLPFYLLEIFLPELQHYAEHPSSHPFS